MSEKSKTKYAILGVLTLRPCSGYDIKKFCDKVIANYWHENYGNIYPMLSQMEESGLVVLDPTDETKRKCYRITEEGRREFTEWLEQPVELKPARSELLLKLSFANQIPREKAVEMLESVRKKHAADLRQYKMMEASFIYDEDAAKDPQYPFLLAPLRYGIEITAAIIKWCEETIENLKTTRS